MRILHVSPQAPDYCSGGAIAVLQSAQMLYSDSNVVDYVGPHICNKEIEKLYDRVYYLQPATKFYEILRILLHFQQNKRFLAWKQLDINLKEYDLVYIEFTKLDYVLRDVIRLKLPHVVRVHNVEYDYSRNDYLKDKTFLKRCTYFFSHKHESYIVKNAAKLITLTNEDKNRLIELYNIVEADIDIIPIALNAPDSKEKIEYDFIPNVLITGSLWYQVNVVGIEWFIKNVLPLLKSKINLRVAGSNPSKDFVKLCEANNIELIISPKSMKEHLGWSDLVVVPIFSGAGMKVKIAEALSYGKPVVTTDYGAIGYELISGVNSYIANDAETFAECIDCYVALSLQEKVQLSRSAKQLFNEKYEISATQKKLAKILTQTCKKNMPLPERE